MKPGGTIIAQPLRFGSGGEFIGSTLAIPGRTLPSRPTSHSPPNTDSDTTYSPFGSTSTSSANASALPREVDRAHQLGLEAVPVAA